MLLREWQKRPLVQRESVLPGLGRALCVLLDSSCLLAQIIGFRGVQGIVWSRGRVGSNDGLGKHGKAKEERCH